MTPEQQAALFDAEARRCATDAIEHRAAAASRTRAGDRTAAADLTRLAKRCDQLAADYRRKAREARRGRL